MIRRRPLFILMLLAALVMALPATAALAQSAGDNQYQDPLGSGGSGGSGGGSGGGSQHQSSAPAQPSPQPAQSAQSSSGTHRAAAPRSVPLARTGFPAWIPLGGGLVLMAGGVLLLVKTPRRTS